MVGSWPRYFGARARAIAVDEHNVFYSTYPWAKDGMDASLRRLPIGGEGIGTEIAHGALSEGLAVDPSGVYVGSAYTPPLEKPELTIARIDPAGTSAEGLSTRSGFNDALLALTPSQVVVFAFGSTNEIFTVNKSDGATKTLATVSYPLQREVHTDGTYAYWIASKQIRRVALDGSKPVETVFAGACEPESLTIDGTHVYFLTSPWGSLKGTTTVWKLAK